MSRAARYGVKLMGVGQAFERPDTPVLNEITLDEFIMKGGMSKEHVLELIELENSEELNGFGKKKYLETLLFKIIDFRLLCREKGLYCKVIDLMLHPKTEKQNKVD
jgi:hypothetical protein